LILWFAGGACLLVWLVLRDPRLDYRVLIGGALLPEVVGVHAHSVVVSVVVLLGVVAVTVGDRSRRRRWLALPIGMFAHLVLDAVWSNTSMFWWPFSGWSLAGERLPSLTRPLWVVVVQEVAGLAALVWVHGRTTADAGSGDVPAC
jgi:hypothetical protein